MAVAPLVSRDRRSLHEIVRGELRELIRMRRFAPSNRLPPETKLAEMMGVSRGTLREAVRSLEREGLLHRRRGIGTFAAVPAALQNSLHVNSGVTQLIQSLGRTPGTKWLRIREEPAGPLVGSRLGLQPGDPVLVVERVRTADGVPVVHSLDIIPRSIAVSSPDFTTAQSIYTYLRDQCRIAVQYGIARLVPTVADQRLASSLGVEFGTLLMLIDQVDYDVDGRAVLFSVEHHLAGAFELTVLRSGTGLAPSEGSRLGVADETVSPNGS